MSGTAGRIIRLLYHRAVPGNFFRALVAALAGVTIAAASAATPTDRLDRFRELAAAQLGLAQLLEAEPPADAYREIYALLDDEIVESLGSGGVFAPLEVLAAQPPAAPL